MFFLILALCFFLTPLPALAQESDLSLEDELSFLDEEWQVESAARYAQGISEAAAAVTIVGAKQIQRYGYLNIDDVLRHLPGFYLTNDRNYSYLGLRGYGLPSDYNSRVLLLLDGHRMNEPIFGSALFGWESGIDIGGAEKIEVVRGPASALYGTNAMFGTVAVHTKNPAVQQGREIHLALGSGEFGRLAARARGSNDTFGYALELHGFYKGGNESLFYPELAEIDYDEDGTPDYDGFTTDTDAEHGVGFRGQLSFGELVFTGFFNSRKKKIPTGPWDTVFDSDETESLDERGYLALAYRGDAGESLDWSARATLDYYNYEGWYAYPFDYDYSSPEYFDPPYTTSRDEQHAWWAGLELQGDFTGLPRNRIIVGGSFRYNWTTMSIYDEEPSFTYLDDDYNYYELAAYLQDEIELLDWARLILGVNYSSYDDNLYKGDVDRANPRAGLVIDATGTATFKVLYGEAFRVPTIYELYYNDGEETIIPNPNLEPEVMKTVEAILEYEVTPSIRFRSSVYYNWIQSLIAANEVEEGVVQFQNSESDVIAKGVEVEIRKAVDSGFSGFASFAYNRTEDEQTEERLPNSPELTASLGLSIPLQRDRTYLSLEERYVGPRRTVDLDDEVDEFFLTDITLSHAGLVKNLDVSFKVSNLFDEDYDDPASFDHRQRRIPQDGRGYAFQATYHF